MFGWAGWRIFTKYVVGYWISFVWMSSMIFDCQGNSNSLASIDVAAGYVGLVDYQPVTVGLFLAAHTYSAPVLSQLLLLSALLRHTSQTHNR